MLGVWRFEECQFVQNVAALNHVAATTIHLMIKAPALGADARNRVAVTIIVN